MAVVPPAGSAQIAFSNSRGRSDRPGRPRPPPEAAFGAPLEPRRDLLPGRAVLEPRVPGLRSRGSGRTAARPSRAGADVKVRVGLVLGPELRLPDSSIPARREMYSRRRSVGVAPGGRSAAATAVEEASSRYWSRRLEATGGDLFVGSRRGLHVGRRPPLSHPSRAHRREARGPAVGPSAGSRPRPKRGEEERRERLTPDDRQRAAPGQSARGRARRRGGGGRAASSPSGAAPSNAFGRAERVRPGRRERSGLEGGRSFRGRGRAGLERRRAARRPRRWSSGHRDRPRGAAAARVRERERRRGVP